MSSWVVKIGSSLLTADNGVNTEVIERFADETGALLRGGTRVVIVSSGAVAAGNAILRISRENNDIALMQVAAAVGQASVIRYYEQAFSRQGYKVAQVLLTHADTGDRRRYLNARNTLRSLLELGVIPIVNENDTVATEEIQFGDNDTLAGLVASMVEADKLVILTDQPGLMSGDPRVDADARLITRGRAGDSSLESMAGPGNGSGRGGMRTKLKAAAIAAVSGCDTCIADGRKAGMLAAIMAGDCDEATILEATANSLAARKRWLFGQTRVQGRLYLDTGAVEHLRVHGSSLLAVGISKCDGDFVRGALVALCTMDGTETGRGLVNYDSDELGKIAGLRSSDIARRLGYIREEEVVHRDNMIIME